jgi:hypothetical protein
MPSHLVCQICSTTYECKCEKTGESEKLDLVTDCALKKGAIYVFVKDDRGKGVGGVKTKCVGKKETKEFNTDPEGFAFYEQLEVDSYPVSMNLEGSELEVRDPHYVIARKEVTATVLKGCITMVEFQIHRYAKVESVVRIKGKGDYFGKATIKMDASALLDHLAEPSKPSLDTASIFFQKVRPTGTYTAAIEIEKDQQKKYRVVGDPSKPVGKVTPEGPNKVEFEVELVYWIQIQVFEGEKLVAGKALLKQEGKDEETKETRGDIDLPNLETEGKLTVNSYETDPESYEFVDIGLSGD